jgi:hypothetical protein
MKVTQRYKISLHNKRYARHVGSRSGTYLIGDWVSAHPYHPRIDKHVVIQSMVAKIYNFYVDISDKG